MKAYWGDIEGTLDRDWAEQIGVDSEQYLVGLADYGEQHVNIADNALKADDCGLVVIDSLAALTPSAEMDALEEQQFIGLQARMITRAVRKLKQRLITERKNEHPCSILFTNQLRIKIGQMHGNPETMAGGHGMHHEFSLLIRIISKSLKRDGVDKKYVGKEQDHAVRHSFAIRKAKVLTLAQSGEFVRAKHDIGKLGLRAGEVDDYNTLMNYAREYGVVEKGAKTYGYFGKRAKRLDDIKEVWRTHPREYMRTEIEIIRRAKERLAGGVCGDNRIEEGETDS
jgi:recombination protein RecA